MPNGHPGILTKPQKNSKINGKQKYIYIFKTKCRSPNTAHKMHMKAKNTSLYKTNIAENT